MWNEFERYAANALDENDVYRALSQGRPDCLCGDAADWYGREGGGNLEPAHMRPAASTEKAKHNRRSGPLSGRTHVLQAEGVK